MAYAFSGDLKCFEILIRHEIGELKRIKRELRLAEYVPAVENFSIALIELPYLKPEHHQPILSSMRACDILSFKDRFIVAFLPGTTKEGAFWKD
jgi:hypothetical protein